MGTALIGLIGLGVTYIVGDAVDLLFVASVLIVVHLSIIYDEIGRSR